MLAKCGPGKYLSYTYLQELQKKIKPLIVQCVWTVYLFHITNVFNV